jgi:hypothetical protein
VAHKSGKSHLLKLGFLEVTGGGGRQSSSRWLERTRTIWCTPTVSCECESNSQRMADGEGIIASTSNVLSCANDICSGRLYVLAPT